MQHRLLLMDADAAIQTRLEQCLAQAPSGFLLERFDPSDGPPDDDFDWSRYHLVLFDATARFGQQSAVDWLRDRGRGPALPAVVVLAAQGAEANAAQALRVGARDYLRLADLSTERCTRCFERALTVEREVAGLADLDSQALDPATLGVGRGNPPPSVAGYRVKAFIGRGVAEVWRAERVADDAPVALKLMRIGAGLGQEHPEAVALRRLGREFTRLASLAHPNVITIYEHAVHEHLAYIAMEFVAGGDLLTRMSEPLAPHRAVDYLRQMAAGIGAAHAKDIIHLDLKPSNVLVRDDDSLAITDFGIAQAINLVDTVSALDMVMGTPSYMSPEQTCSDAVDARSDLYSLGVILFQMLTGERPYRAKRLMALIEQHLQAPIPRLPTPLHALQPIVDRLLAKAPEDRFASSAALLQALDKVTLPAAR